MTEVVVAVSLGLLLLVGREIVTHEYLTWAGFLARGLVRLGGRLDRFHRDEWRAELHEVQEVRHESGLGFAVAALLSGVRAAAKLQRRERVVPAARVEIPRVVDPLPLPGPDRRRRSATQEEFGRRVRLERNRQGLTQEELGERAGIHRTYIGHVERGEVNPTLHVVVWLAAGLGVDPGSLVGGSSAPPAATTEGARRRGRRGRGTGGR